MTKRAAIASTARPSPTGTSASAPLQPSLVAEIRRSRRHPRPTQFDYLHLRQLLEDLASALENVRGPVRDVLDVYCGTRPYEDLLPAGARCVGLDIDDRYGTADVVTNEFLPFPDASFDLVLSTEAFHYVSDPAAGVAEIHRILRPGGTALITVPFVWEYDRTTLEHRFTGPSLASLFREWDDVEVVENGGRAVSWTTLTASMLRLAESHLPRRLRLDVLVRPLFPASYLLVNGIGVLLDRLERRHPRNRFALPMNLLLTARRPADA